MTTIRPANPADAAGIAQVHTLSWQRAYRTVVPDHFLDALQWELREQFWAKELLAPSLAGSTVLVAEDGGPVVGFVATGPARDEDGQGCLEVYALYVVPEAWDTGTGRALLEAALAAVPAEDDVSLWVLEGNARGRRFYERQGFTADGSTKVVEIGGAPLVELRYRRAVAT